MTRRKAATAPNGWAPEAVTPANFGPRADRRVGLLRLAWRLS